MRKNIAIIIPSSKSGGVFQLGLSIAESLINYCGKFNYKVIHCESDNLKQLLYINENKAQFLPIPQEFTSLVKRCIHFIKLISGSNHFVINNFDQFLKKANINLLIYPTPFTYGFSYKIPYIVFIPNLMHKYYPGFPEFGFKQNIIRDIVYKLYAKNSIFNIVDSEQGAEDIYKFSGIKKEKSRIISFVPAGYVYKYRDMDNKTVEDTLAQYNLPEKFIFYPAQFWYHKNHIRLINALDLIRNKYKVKINLVLVGSSTNNYSKRYQEIKRLIEKLNIEDLVRYLGYVSDKTIIALFKRATALVFPSLFGPTDIPCLEAMLLGTPVVCSNLFEIPKQVGNAGLFFNPFKVEEMAEKIYEIWTNEELRQQLIKNGKERTCNLTLENYAKKWEKIIEEAL